MKNLIIIMGKSGSGKDTIYKEILKKDKSLHPIVLYTTRDIRPGEKNGVDYHFVSEKEYKEIKSRREFSANLYYGKWYYGIKKDVGTEDNYIVVATPAEVLQLKEAYKNDPVNIYLFLIKCDEEMRIIKLFEREDKKIIPDYHEIVRRLKTDRFDFSDNNDDMTELEKDIQIIYNNYEMTPEEIADEFLYQYKHNWK